MNFMEDIVNEKENSRNSFYYICNSCIMVIIFMF